MAVSKENYMKMLSDMTAEIIAAYVRSHIVATEELSELILRVHQSLARLSASDENTPVNRSYPSPAVPINESISPDYVVCLEDGKPYKSLKRHLRCEHGLSPALYRAKWDLPVDYPIVAPSYGKRRSKLAKDMGLGRKRARGQ